jgi:hypothetical protein
MYPPLDRLAAYEVRHLIQPALLKEGCEVALLNEYLVGEIEAAMIKDPQAMRAHLVSLYQYMNIKPVVH